MKWISVEDRLPDDSFDYDFGTYQPTLLFVYKGGVYAGTFSDNCWQPFEYQECEGLHWIAECYPEDYSLVTHWMPLPPLPGDENNSCSEFRGLEGESLEGEIISEGGFVYWNDNYPKPTGTCIKNLINYT